MNMLTNTGIIKYDPYRGGMKTRTDWWCVLEIDKGITEYYRWWIRSELHECVYPPSWNAHVSILRGEKPSASVMHMWKKHDRQEIKFNHSITPKKVRNKKNPEIFYWVVNVESVDMVNMRKELNLPTTWSLHLTVGKSYY